MFEIFTLCKIKKKKGNLNFKILKKIYFYNYFILKIFYKNSYKK